MKTKLVLAVVAILSIAITADVYGETQTNSDETAADAHGDVAFSGICAASNNGKSGNYEFSAYRKDDSSIYISAAGAFPYDVGPKVDNVHATHALRIAGTNRYGSVQLDKSGVSVGDVFIGTCTVTR